MITIDEPWFNLYRQPENDQTRVCPRPEEKSDSVVASSRYGRKMMVILVVDIRDISHCEILAENETNEVRYLKFLEKLMTTSTAIESIHYGYSMTMPDLIVIPQLLPRVTKGLIQLVLTILFVRCRPV